MAEAMRPQVLVLADRPGPRVAYVVRHVLGRMLGLEPVLANGEEEFRSSALPRLRYGRQEGDVVTVPDSGGLERCVPAGPDPPVGVLNGVPVLYPVGDRRFDLFAAAFHLLSRVEEYGAHPMDAHGRLPSGSHLTVRHGMAHIPVVDHWALGIHADLRARHPGLPSPTRSYRHVVTVDLDNGMMVLGRPAWRQAGAVVRDVLKGVWSDAGMRIAVGLGRRKDPFDRYDRWVKLCSTSAVERTLAFVLVAGGGRHDHAASLHHKMYRSGIAGLKGQVQVGIHPSYATSEREGLMAAEMDTLRSVTGGGITASRQHFLRWRLPHTLREAAGNGITEEHSIGFADRCGFRAGTCTPFRWYDLEREVETDLVLWPFACMDSALHDRMGLGPEEALHHATAMNDAVRAVQGTFVSVWHDRFLSGHGSWQGWPEVMQRLIEHAAP